MYFEIVGEITDVEVIASGQSIHFLPVLNERYGEGRWRKLKGRAWVRLEDGRLCSAEVHGTRPMESAVGMKIKRLLD